MNNKWPRLTLSALALSLGIASSASAGLSAVDQGPYTAATGGYPMWYQDARNVKLELCTAKTVSSRLGNANPPNYMCILNAEGGFDPAQPIVFPNNWPGESFWTLVEAEIPEDRVRGYELETYVAALEAAFSTEEPIDGNQQSFARIRLRISVPVAGTYKVTHPYGVETFNVTKTGRRAINMTRDIGIGAPGNFSGPLGGDVGPFLYSAAAPNVLLNGGQEVARYYNETNPETGVTERYLGDPNLLEAVRGSPFNTNFVRIEGPAGTIQTNLFSVSGKLYDDRTQTPVKVERATYSRTAATTQVEVFGSSSNSSSLCFRETLQLVPGTPPSACQFPMLTDNNGQFFARHDLPASAPPPFVVITASSITGVTKPTSVSRDLVDVVKIGSARFDWATRKLTVEASSSDAVNVPELSAQGFGKLTRSGTLQSLTVENLSQPPASVTVKSSAGGSDTEPVSVVGFSAPQAQNKAPLAAADSASTRYDTSVSINVLANDSDPDNDVPLAIADFTQPAAGQGTVVAQGTALLYTPPAVVSAPLNATFTYRAKDTKGLASLPATVIVNVTPKPNLPPKASNDLGSVQVGSLTLKVLDNDSDPEGGSLSVANLTQPASGQGSVSTNGTTVTYNPPALVLFPFTATFTYQARDNVGNLSAPATVSVQVSLLSTLESLSVGTAQATARAGGRYDWTFSGNSSVILGNTITVYVNTPNGVVPLGNASVSLLLGRWSLTVNNSTIAPSSPPTAAVRSSLGTVRNVTVNVR